MPAAIPLIAGAFLAAGSVATAVGLGTLVVAGLAISWAAVLTVTGVALLAVAYLARKTPKPESAGQQLQQKLDPQAPVPIAYGRTATGGFITWRGTWGKKNAFYGIVTVLSAGGPIAGIESYRAGDYPIGFSGSPAAQLATCNNVGGYSGSSKLYKGKLRQRWVPGNAPARDTPASLTGYPIPAGAMSGLAASITSYEYNADAFPQGLPASLWTLNGVKLYDPRKDSTYPGGSGAQRVDQPATWTFSENPYLAALQWTLGRYENGKRVYGIGARWSEVDVASFVNGANVADANGWKLGGVVTTSDEKYAVLASLLTCGSGVPVARGAQIACSVNAPKTAVLTLNKEDIIGEVEISSTTSWRDRQNTIIPRYREESQNWEIISGERLSADTYVAEDGGETKTVEIEFPLVQQAKQAHQLAAYELVNSREFLTFTVNAKMRMLAARVGDAIMVNVPQVAARSIKCTVAGREFNPADLSVTLTLKSETDAKHAYALGQTQVAPPSPKLDGYDPSNPEAPASTAWAITATAIKNDTVTLPAIVVTGATDDPNAATIIFEYRPLGSSEWLNGGEYPRTTNRVELTSVTTGTAYEVAVSYRTNLNVIGERLVLGATAGDMKVDWQTIVDGAGKPDDNATDGATVGGNIKDVNGNFLGRDQIINAEGSFNAVATYNFDDDTFQGVMSGGASISVAPGSGILRFEATTTDPMLYIPINRPGKDAYIIRVLARRLSETNSWQGQVYYSINNGRGESEGFTKRIPTPDIVANKWTVFEWDMRNLTAGGTDYIDSDIVRARIDLDQALTVWEIEAIQIGNRQGASLGAPDGTLVGGKPVEDIIDAITNPAGQLIPIKDILVDVSDLQTVFGDTVSAGTARDAALASQNAAKLSEDTVTAAKAAVLVSQSAAKVSEDNAGKAKDQASAAQGLAEAAARDATATSGLAGQASADASAAKTAAQTAQSDAEAKARAAGVSANDASGYATTASGWASNAQQKADAAGQSATIATGKADIATTKAAEALVSSNNASASESNAAGSASSASQQAVVSSRAAQDSAANAANDNRSPGAAPTLWAYNDYNNFKPITRLPATTNGDFSYANSVLRMNNGFHIHPVEPMRVDPSKRYRAVVRFKLVQDGPQSNGHCLYITFWNAAGELLTGNTVLAKRIETTTVAAGWVELAQTLSLDGAAGTMQWPATTAFFRVMYRSSGTPTDIALLYAEDVEAKLAADASAVAASGSASSAATKADLAGQKAEAASGSAATAGTKAGEALASEGKAAKSASDASGSASSASTSSNVAATAKTAAETAAKRTFPTTFEDNLTYFSSPLPRTVVDGAYVFSNASVGTFANILRRGVSSNAPGKKWKVRMRAKADRAGANSLMRVMAFTDDGQATNPPTPYYTEAVVGVTTSWAWYEIILDAPANGSLVAPIVYPSYPALNAIVSVSALEMFDATSEQAALASATASATSASTAAASKKDAGDQASAASTSATNAKTSAGEAKTSASNASTSESEAGKSAATASTQAGVSARAASDGAATIANADRSPGAALSLWSYNDYNTFRPTTRLTTESAAITSVAGTLRVSSAGAFHIHPVAPIRMQPGKRYRAFVRFRMTEDGPQSSHHYLFASFFDANGSILAGNVVTLTAMGPTTVAAGWQELSRDFSSDGNGGTYGAPAGTAFMRVMYRTSGTAEEIALLYIEDVEGQLASAGSASAASASASTATASKDLAGQSASAAEGSKTKAETAAGAAEISRAAAAISESNAAGSSNSAATSQKLAASAGATRGLSTNGMFAAGDVGYSRYGVYYGNLYQGVGYRSNTGVAGTVTSEQFIPVDISRTYRLTTAYVVHGVAQTIYAGVGCFDAQKAFLGNIYMPQILPIIQSGGTVIPTVSNEYSGSYPEATPMFRHGSSFPAATKFVQPIAFLNYDNVAGGISDINALYLEDITSEKNARDKAQASNDSSASAAASAKGAEQSASASEISRQAAVTAKGGAEAARDAAVISASNAEGSSNTATSSAALAATANRGATATVASTLPSDFSQGPLFWSANYSGPDTRDKAIPAHYNFETDTGVLRATGGGFNDIAHLASIPLVKGKRHRLTAVWNVINAAGAPSANCTVYFIGLNGNMAGNFTPGANFVIPGSGPGWGDNNGFQVSVFDYNDDDMLANGSIRVRGLFRYNNDSQNQQWRLKSFVLEDITSEAASKDSASASNISAGAASASAGKAGDYASAANQSRIDAQAASDKSLGQAGIATTAAATATSQAALATTSATLSAAVSSGLANRGATFSDWPDAAAIPTYWSGWGNSANNRKIGIVGRYGFQQYAANGAAETGLYSDARFDNGFTSLKSGTYVVDAEVTLDGGSFYGSGVLFRAFDSNGGIVQDTPLNFGAMKSDISPDAATGDGMAGSRYRFTELVTLPASTASVGMYAMTQWAGFGARAEKLLTWHKVGPRRASQQEIQSGKVAGLDARVTTQAGAISTLTGKNMAWLQQDVSAGNGRAIVSLKADGVTGSSQIDFAASQIRFMNSSGSLLAPTFTVAGGNVSIAGDLYMGSGRIVSTNGSYMKVQGTGFGTTNQFIEWFGPNMAISACSEANAKSYLRTDGQAYFGGALLAGTLRTSNTNPSVQASVTATSGPISSNGGVVVINVSWSYNTSQVAYYAGTQAGLQNFRNVAASYGGVNNGSGSWSGSQVRDNGTSTLTLSKDGNPVHSQTTNSVVFSVFGIEPNQGAGEDGQLTITSSASIVFTYSDSTRNTNNREYTATLARSSGITPGGGTVRQGVSINTVE